MFYYAPPDTGGVEFATSCLRMFAAKRPADKKLGSTNSHWILSYRGKSPEKPKRFFWSVQGGPEGNRNPSGLFFFCQRFLLEKQKKMLKGSCKSVQSISLLIDFRLPRLQPKFSDSIPSVSLRLTAPLAARGAKKLPCRFSGRAVWVWVWAYSKTTFSALQTAAQRGQRPCSSGVSECIQQRGHFVPVASLTATVRPG